MELTPKLKKRVSLTLGRHHKGDASPYTYQEKAHSKISNAYNSIDTDEFNVLKTPKSPSVTALSTDVIIECTPPNKKVNLDESVDYSPKCFDTSFSPTCLLSQTLSSNSPEVGWKWGRRSMDEKLEAIITPDSAYAAGSSYTSAGSSNTEATNALGRLRSESKVARFAYEMRREEHRRSLEMQMRRAEKLRADELLKQRCAKLEEQLREAEKRRREHVGNKMTCQKQPKPKRQEILEYCAKISQDEEAAAKGESTNPNDTLEDFLNDSDSDSILFQTSQQVESNIIDIAQKTTNEDISYKSTNENKNVQSKTSILQKDDIASECQDKRSSLYKKFLEYDLSDNLFLSFDDEFVQATQQAKKSRKNFYRHNSLPTSSKANSREKSLEAKTTKTTSTSSSFTNIASTSRSVSLSKMKRHASSHALSLSSDAVCSYRDRQGFNRK